MLEFAHVFSAGVAAAVGLFLAYGSLDVIAESRRFERELAYGIPVWTVQVLLPLGFVLVALRLLWHAGKTWRGRVAALGVALVIMAIGFWAVPGRTLGVARLGPEHFRWPAIALLLLAIVLGAPVYAALGGAALIFFWTAGEPISVVPFKHYRLTVNPTLPSIRCLRWRGTSWRKGRGEAVRGAVRLLVWPHPRRAGDHHGDGLRLLHVVHGGLRRDGAGAGRAAAAGVARGGLSGA